MKCRSGELSRENKWKDCPGYGYMINYQIGSFPEKEYWAEMVCYFTGVYMTNKTLYDRLQIQNFYSCIQKSLFVRCIHTWHSKINFVCSHVHVISSICIYSLCPTGKHSWLISLQRRLRFKPKYQEKIFQEFFFCFIFFLLWRSVFIGFVSWILSF